MSNDEKFVWIDTETTGLSPNSEVPLELGFTITDTALNVLDSRAWLIYSPAWNAKGYYTKKRCGDYVHEMHTKSGLWEELPSGWSVEAVGVAAAHWLMERDVTKSDPMCGSSVQFDREWAREWFPEVHDLFSYRNIDISTLKELMKRLAPDIYALQPESEYYSKRELHRVLPDLEDTISEFKFYRQEFLYVPADFS